LTILNGLSSAPALQILQSIYINTNPKEIVKKLDKTEQTFYVFLPFPVLVNKYGCSEEFDQDQLHRLYSEEPERWNTDCQK